MHLRRLSMVSITIGRVYVFTHIAQNIVYNKIDEYPPVASFTYQSVVGKPVAARKDPGPWAWVACANVVFSQTCRLFRQKQAFEKMHPDKFSIWLPNAK
jgi:hypothetical protein